MKKFIFLVNPVSGTVKKHGIVELIKQQAAAGNHSFAIYPTRADGDYAELAEKIRVEGITHIGIVGGDGSVNQAVNYLRDLPVEFGIIPMGSGNGLAYTARIPKNPRLALQLILEGQSRIVDAFLVNDHFSCMLSGIGFDAKVAHEFAHKASRGLMTYTRQTLINYFSCGTYPFEVKVADFSFTTNAFFISIANSNQFGNRVTIAPQASLSDGLLDIVIVQKMSKAWLPFAVLGQLRGGNKLQVLATKVLKKHILYFQASSLSISNPAAAPLHVDGEPKPAEKNFEIKVLPGCFRLIQP